MRTLRLTLVAAALTAALACKPDGKSDPVELGRAAYKANCIACHSPDPTKEGTIGPAIAGSAPELVRARVLHAEYPPGYAPKRDSHLMPAQPFLASDVENLAAYLGSLPATR